MHLLLIVWLVACAAGAVVSLRSMLVLGAASPFTRFGWAATVAYFIVAGIDAARARTAPAHLDYVAIGLLIVGFAVAGVRDEPQAQPWWWPSEAGQTGRERRERRERR